MPEVVIIRIFKQHAYFLIVSDCWIYNKVSATASFMYDSQWIENQIYFFEADLFSSILIWWPDFNLITKLTPKMDSSIQNLLEMWYYI